MAKPQKSTAQSEVPGLVKKGPLYYLKRDWQLYALMLLPMVFIIVFKYFAYTGLSVAFLDYKIGKGYAGSKFVGLKIFEKVFKHRDFTKAVVSIMHFVATIFSLLFFNYYAKTLKNFNLEHSYSLYIEKIRLFIWIIIVMLHLVSCISLAFMVVSAISYF